MDFGASLGIPYIDPKPLKPNAPEGLYLAPVDPFKGALKGVLNISQGPKA